MPGGLGFAVRVIVGSDDGFAVEEAGEVDEALPEPEVVDEPDVELPPSV